MSSISKILILLNRKSERSINCPPFISHPSQSKLTTYLEDIALLQRGTSECLISIATCPQVSGEILANCGVLIVFKSYMQRSLLREILNLEEENEDYVSILEEGQCIARVNSVRILKKI